MSKPPSSRLWRSPFHFTSGPYLTLTTRRPTSFSRSHTSHPSNLPLSTRHASPSLWQGLLLRPGSWALLRLTRTPDVKGLVMILYLSMCWKMILLWSSAEAAWVAHSEESAVMWSWWEMASGATWHYCGYRLPTRLNLSERFGTDEIDNEQYHSRKWLLCGKHRCCSGAFKCKDARALLSPFLWTWRDHVLIRGQIDRSTSTKHVVQEHQCCSKWRTGYEEEVAAWTFSYLTHIPVTNHRPWAKI